jgi:hypothetical protein
VLAKALSRGDSDLTLQSVKALCAAGYAARDALPQLLSVFDRITTHSEAARLYAHRLLTNLGPVAVKALIAAIEKGQDDRQVSAAVRSLEAFGAEATAAAPVLESIAETREGALRDAARNALKAIQRGSDD